MRKLKLDPESLDVLSFESVSLPAAGGTVAGHADDYFMRSEDVCLSVQVVCVSKPCPTS
jgi:hypothetical protein